MWIVDTNVLSATAPTKAVQREMLRAWMERNSGMLFLSVITVAEVEDGIARIVRMGAVAKARALTAWLETVLHLYRDRVLPVDVAVARRMGVIADRARGAGHDPGLADVAIAATADVWGFGVLTGNVRHFGALGARVVDPWASLPAGE